MKVENTGKIDKIIEEKVNKEISDFADKITNQVIEFLEKNGSPSGNYFYQASGWESDNSGHYEITETNYLPSYFFKLKLIAGFNKSVKDKMITRETKTLLEKIVLLS